jgi:sensor histidine kinase YesM
MKSVFKDIQAPVKNHLTIIFGLNIKMPALGLTVTWKGKDFILYSRWPWHVLFWIGYVLFRFWPYVITVKYYPPVYLQYMLLSEILFVAAIYYTLWSYRRWLTVRRYLVYFSVGTLSWLLYLYGRTVFQLYYLKNEPGFRGSTWTNILISNITNITFVLVSFLFITACKYFKDGYISQQLSIESRQQQLVAEVNNLKSQIAPHFLFNTLNNLYGLAVSKSDKLPDLMLRLSDLLRHSLYETQKPFVPISDEIDVLKSYIKLESVRLEDDLKLEFDNGVPDQANYQVAPLILIVFMENAFKHAKFVRSSAVNIYIKTTLEDDWFSLVVRNNYNKEKTSSGNGIGLTNVKRRLEVLYSNNRHQLTISEDEIYYTVTLRLQLIPS